MKPVVHRGATHCAVCHLGMQDHAVAQTRQVFELPELAMRTVAHQQIRSTCTCGAAHLGAWPVGVNAPVQYGASVKAMAVHLNQFHLVPLGRTTALMQDIYGAHVTQASIQSFTQEAALSLQATVASIGQAVQGSGVVHADETGIRITGKLHWLHCAVTTTLTWLAPHAKRGTQAFEALGLLQGIKGVLVHDGLASYKGLECTHSLCNAHHIRELVYIHEHDREKIWDPWAQEMKEVWRFMREDGVPFTNNLAEQALQMAKVKQKISGCFRTEHGAPTFFVIRSYLATMTKQKANLFDCLVSVFNHQPIQPCFDG